MSNPISMNEWNKTAFSEKWNELKRVIKDADIPHIQGGSKLIVIAPFPHKLISVIKDISHSTYFDSEQEDKCLIEIPISQFVLTKEDQWQNH